LPADSTSEFGNFYWPFHRKALAMQLDALNLMEGFCSEIALTATRAAYDGNVLYYQKVPAFAVGPGHPADSSAVLSTNIASH
jgi:hypothetical protein